MKKLKNGIAVLVILLFLIIVVQNTQAITLKFLLWKITASRIILIPLLALMGFVIGYIVAKTEKK